MGLFDRFRRNQQDSVLPDEVREYYEAGQQPRRGVAILLTLAALVATVAIVAGLFFAGRFIYNEFIRDDKPQSQNNGGQGQPTLPGEQNGDSQNQQNDQQNQGQSGQTQQPSQPQNNQSQGSTGTQQQPAQPQPQAGGQGGGTVPALGDNLPRTGDEGL